MTRRVQGVELQLPWGHRLPDYAAASPAYGQNLVALARGLARTDEPLRVVDVGANVGDSALQVLAAVDARVLCVEGDPHWLRWLERNTAGHFSVTIAPGLLTVGHAAATVPERRSGTTRFVTGERDGSLGALPVDGLRTRYPDFADVRLVKSDTDGYDVVLVPALAREWAATAPVVFFEYDLGLSRAAGHDPAAVWPALADLGYDAVAVWDNLGAPLGAVTVADLVAEPDPARLLGGAAPYWDVAVARADDEHGTAAVRASLS